MLFLKYHALGNDYLVLKNELFGEQTPGWAVEPDKNAIIRICDRNLGLGSDGILIGEQISEIEFGFRIFNPDGSEAEKSGNGLRIFVRSLWDSKRVEEEPFSIRTLGGQVQAKVLEQGAQVEVDMGQVSFSSSAIPIQGNDREVIRETIEVGGRSLEFCGATVGNPHCVVLSPEGSEEAKRLGPLIENHPFFIHRTNVQFLEVLDRQTIRIEIWERGAGYTLASGSSSSAAAAVARKLGLCDEMIEVQMPGGSLMIGIDEDWSVMMRGPVTLVGSMTADKEIFE